MVKGQVGQLSRHWNKASELTPYDIYQNYQVENEPKLLQGIEVITKLQPPLAFMPKAS